MLQQGKPGSVDGMMPSQGPRLLAVNTADCCYLITDKSFLWFGIIYLKKNHAKIMWYIEITPCKLSWVFCRF